MDIYIYIYSEENTIQHKIKRHSSFLKGGNALNVYFLSCIIYISHCEHKYVFIHFSMRLKTIFENNNRAMAQSTKHYCPVGLVSQRIKWCIFMGNVSIKSLYKIKISIQQQCSSAFVVSPFYYLYKSNYFEIPGSRKNAHGFKFPTSFCRYETL